MRITEFSKYPHPILSKETHDFKKGKFLVTYRVEEDPVNNSLKLECNVSLEEKKIQDLIEEESVEIALDIHCPETYNSFLRKLSLGTNNISFSPGLLSGRVVLRPLIYATIALPSYVCNSFHDEYGNQVFALVEGDILAWESERILNVGRKKLAPMDSIFEMVLNSNLEEGRLGVTLDTEKIQINAAKKTFEDIYNRRQTAEGQSLALNSIYLPAVMQVLTYLMQNNGTEFADREWFQIFKSKCDFYNIDLQNHDILDNAATLLQNPYLNIMERFKND
jgi:hypothetical protein